MKTKEKHDLSLKVCLDVDTIDGAAAAYYLCKLEHPDAANTHFRFVDCNFLIKQYEPVTDDRRILTFIRDIMAANHLDTRYNIVHSWSRREIFDKGKVLYSPSTHWKMIFNEEETEAYHLLEQLTPNQLGELIAFSMKEYYVSNYDESYIEVITDSWTQRLRSVYTEDSEAAFDVLYEQMVEAAKVPFSHIEDEVVVTPAEIVAMINKGVLGDFDYFEF